MNKSAKIYVAGHRGLAGSAVVKELQANGFNNLLLKTSKEVDLRDPVATDELFAKERPECVIMCAGTVGGIIANTNFPVEFTQNNALMIINTLTSAHKYNVNKFLYLGSSCIYPKECPQPMNEEHLLTGLLEPTNEGYALAKIMGIKLCEYYKREFGKDFIALMPSNLYGPNDNYDLEHSHVIGALLRRFHEAKLNNLSEVLVWGTGTPRREFTYIEDFAKGVLFAMTHTIPYPFFNLGVGYDISIKELAEEIASIIGYDGRISFDSTKPDGMKQKLMDSSKILKMGWKPQISLKEGLKLAYEDFVKQYNNNATKEHKIQ
ncbi:MAG: GDP-L-fucose synthase family protein [Brevinema sp.]